MNQSDSDLQRTALHALHLQHGAKMVPFAGYDMPVSYPLGVMKEHLHTRSAAGLFDVSHMGQIILQADEPAVAQRALERLIPQDVLGLPVGRQRYGFFTNDQGGIEDDLMFANRGDHFFLVVNAACKQADVARLRAALEPEVSVTEIQDRALLALQGPAAEAILGEHHPGYARMRFMDVAPLPLADVECWVSRSGYTGEDGFEISIPEDASHAVVTSLLADPRVALIGLGARDSLRLEAGLCLYGQDIDAGSTPLAARLGWAIQKTRRPGGARAGGYPGAEILASEWAEGTTQARVGLRPKGRAPMRAGVTLYADLESETPIGHITSGGFGPSVAGPVAMGYVGLAHAKAGTVIYGELRGKRQAVDVVDLPFVAANFKR